MCAHGSFANVKRAAGLADSAFASLSVAENLELPPQVRPGGLSTEQIFELFPNLRGIGISHRGHGKVGLTIDEFPHLHEPQDGVLIGVGYNGRGVAAATTMGRIIAERITEGPIASVLPVTSLSGIPWRVLRQPLLTAAVTYYRLRDQLGLGA